MWCGRKTNPAVQVSLAARPDNREFVHNPLFNDILFPMKRLLFLIFCLLPAVQAAEQPVAELGAEFWFTPRHGDVIAGRADLGEAVKKLIAEPEAYLILRYPETESGELWGRELQAWLVSLGVVSDRIELQPDPAHLESVEVVLISPALEMEEAPPLQIDEQPLEEEGGGAPPSTEAAAASMQETDQQRPETVEVVTPQPTAPETTEETREQEQVETEQE